MNELLDFLSQIGNVDPAAAKDLESLMHRRVYAKGEHLLEIGTVSQHAYFLEQGLVRGYYKNKSGEEFTTWLHSAPKMFASFKSYSSGTPGVIAAVFLERSIIQSISKPDLMTLCAKHPVLFQLLHYTLQEACNRMIDHTMMLQSMDASERYEQFRQLYPQLVDRVNLGHIASYLGINQATLSRIRAKSKQ
jgi:CRP-like cAMP-binding protein